MLPTRATLPFPAGLVLMLLALTPASGHAQENTGLAVGMPSGFADLARAQQVVADLYFGGESIGQTQVEGGTVRLNDPAAAVGLIPQVADVVAVTAALGGPLDAHADLVCSQGSNPDDCGRLAPPVAGVIFDRDHFRLTLFVSPRYLILRSAMQDVYLPMPEAGLSLVDWVAGTVAGSSGGRTEFAIQNRAVLGDRDARLVSTTSYSSTLGLKGDVLAVQVDKPGIRYTAGAFWAAGLDLAGRRRILGAGVETQFDTRADKDVISGTPLIVSLVQRSRVDMMIDGRLVGSRIYDAGNQSLDTSALPDGSYEVKLLIQEIGGAQREERRFFAKNARIAPAGEWLWFARGGVLVQDRPGAFLSATRKLYAEAGASRRLGRHFALDTIWVASGDRLIAEAGAYLMTAPAQFRLAVLGSSKMDSGILFQANSTGVSRLNFNIDARRVRTHDDGPLVASSDLTGPMANRPGFPAARPWGGSFTQVMGDISYRLKHAQINLSAFYRRDHLQDHYAVGPTARWSVLRRGGVDLTLEGNLSQSSIGLSGYAGIRLQILRPRRSLSMTAGVQSLPSAPGRRNSGVVGGVQGNWQNDDVRGGSLMLVGSVDHLPNDDVAHARADWRGPIGALGADVVQQLDGAGHTQFSLTGQTSLIASRGMATLGGRDQSDSMIAVRLKDAPPDAVFEVLVNETPRARLRGGETQVVAVPSYRQYGVRIRPVGGSLAHFDTATRRISVFPGNVATLAWSAKSVVAMFGRMLWPDGEPVAEADIVTRDAIARTDSQGYFQIETSRDADLGVRASDGRNCQVSINAPESTAAYIPLGTVLCRPYTPLGPSWRIAANEGRP